MDADSPEPSASLPAQLPEVGSLLEGRYRLDREVGRGGFGVVFQAFHVALACPIAVKLVALRRGDGHELADFLDEARLLSRLRHPHVVRVLDAGAVAETGERGPCGWMVMEWCEGRTLAEPRDAARPRGVRETWDLTSGLIEAVAALHEAGVVHRDLKPSNVMMVEEGGRLTPRLIDFGIAKRVQQGAAPSDDQATRGKRTYTPAYAAPEQVMALRTGPWTDVHALGLLLVELLTGAQPYGPAVEPALILAEPRPTPAQKGFDVGAWEPVLARALALKTTDRFANARELHVALEAALPPSSGEAAAPSAPAVVGEAPARSGLTVVTVDSPARLPPQPPIAAASSAPALAIDLPSLVARSDGPTIVVVWRSQRATAEDVQACFVRVLDHLREACAAETKPEARRRFAMVVGIDGRVPLPPDEVRALIGRETRRLDDYLFCGATVVEQEGLRGVAQRAAVSTMQLLARPQRPERTFAAIAAAAEFVAAEAQRAAVRGVSAARVIGLYERVCREAFP